MIVGRDYQFLILYQRRVYNDGIWKDVGVWNYFMSFCMLFQFQPWSPVGGA